MSTKKPARAFEKPARTFDLHWGSGIIAEEVQIETAFHRPTIQLLEATGGDAAGTVMIRFCHYDLRGRFQRSPLIVSDRDVRALRAALRKTPRLRALLAKLVS